jgi:hypothetical protein
VTDEQRCAPGAASAGSRAVARSFKGRKGRGRGTRTRSGSSRRNSAARLEGHSLARLGRGVGAKPLPHRGRRHLCRSAGAVPGSGGARLPLRAGIRHQTDRTAGGDALRGPAGADAGNPEPRTAQSGAGVEWRARLRRDRGPAAGIMERVARHDRDDHRHKHCLRGKGAPRLFQTQPDCHWPDAGSARWRFCRRPRSYWPSVLP